MIRELLKYGFKDYNGQIWANNWVDSYNQIQKDINREILSFGYASEELLNLSHRQFCIFVSMKNYKIKENKHHEK